jgi:hypothetical protein
VEERQGRIRALTRQKARLAVPAGRAFCSRKQAEHPKTLATVRKDKINLKKIFSKFKI